MRVPRIVLAMTATLLAVPAAGQLVPGVSVPQLPPVPAPDLPVGRTVDGVTQSVGATADRLLEARLERIDTLVRRNRDTIELDAQGAPA